MVDEEDSDEDWKPPPLDGFGAFKRRRPKSEGESDEDDEDEDIKDEFGSTPKAYKVKVMGGENLCLHVR